MGTGGCGQDGWFTGWSSCYGHHNALDSTDSTATVLAGRLRGQPLAQVSLRIRMNRCAVSRSLKIAERDASP